jgi:hypothetical protein
MSDHNGSCWTVDRETGSAATQVVISLRRPESVDVRDDLLTRGVVAAMTALVDSSRAARPIVVDLRPGVGTDTGIEAYVEAVRGLVQSIVLEAETPVAPVNIVVTTADQARERRRTVEYLSSANGGFSCGATYDLREAVS